MIKRLLIIFFLSCSLWNIYANTICQYDANSGEPNFFGMRTFVSIVEEITVDGLQTNVVYEIFPARVDDDLDITISTKNVLTFYRVKANQVKQLLLKNPKYYKELLGYELKLNERKKLIKF